MLQTKREDYRKKIRIDSMEKQFQQKRSRPAPDEIIPIEDLDLLGQLKQLDIDCHQSATLFIKEQQHLKLHKILFENQLDQSNNLKQFLDCKRHILKEILYLYNTLSAYLDNLQLVEVFPLHQQQFLIQLFYNLCSFMPLTDSKDLVVMIDYLLCVLHNLLLVSEIFQNIEQTKMINTLKQLLHHYRSQFSCQCIETMFYILAKLLQECSIDLVQTSLNYFMTSPNNLQIQSTTIQIIGKSIRYFIFTKQNNNLKKCMELIITNHLNDLIITLIINTNQEKINTQLFQYFKHISNYESQITKTLISQQNVIQIINLHQQVYINLEDYYFFLSSMLHVYKTELPLIYFNNQILMDTLIINVSNQRQPIAVESYYLLCILVRYLNPIHNLQHTIIPSILHQQFIQTDDTALQNLYIETLLANPELFERNNTILSKLQALSLSEGHQISHNANKLLDFIGL